MWTKGTLNGYDFCIKHYEVGSPYGICKGRISKLEIRKQGKILVNYDRGWDMKPEGSELTDVYKEMLKQYD